MTKLFGTLHTPLKPSSYRGGSTNDIKISIDNTNLIKAELTQDVKNYIQDIKNSTVDLNNSNREYIDTKSAEILNNLNNFKLKTGNDLISLENYINTEIDSLQKNLENRIDTEVTPAIDDLEEDITELSSFDESISNSLQQFKEEYTAQIRLMSTADANNLALIESEKIRAIERENEIDDNLATKYREIIDTINSDKSELQEKIDEESVRAYKSEALLDDKITEVQDSLSDKLDNLDSKLNSSDIEMKATVDNIISSIEAIQGNIEVSVEEYRKSDDQLQAAITSEVDRAKLAEKGLQDKIDSNTSAISLLTDGVDPDIVDGVNDLIDYVSKNGPQVISMQRSIEQNASNIETNITNIEKNASDIVSEKSERVAAINTELSIRSAADKELEDKIILERSSRELGDLDNKSSIDELRTEYETKINDIESKDKELEDSLNALETLLNKFHPLQFKSKISLSPSICAKGTEPYVTAAWTMNREPNELYVTIKGTETVLLEDEGEGDIPDISYKYSWDANKEQDSIMVNADGLIDEAAVTFTYYIFYGVNGPTLSNLELLTKKLSTSKNIGNITVTVNEGEYFWYAIPADYGEPIFKVGGFEGGVTKQADTLNMSYGDESITYMLYRSTQSNLGNTTFNIS